MDILTLLGWLQQTGLAVQIRDSLFLFPLLESAHVIGLALVFGTIAIVDLRLFGVASTNRPFRRLAADTLKWTWAAFALTAVTGGLMFITNAAVYYGNSYFRAKMVLLVLAALNVLAFELTAGRTVEQWDQAPAAPPVGRAIAVLSLFVWVGVIVTGRMIGFTVTRAAAAESAPVETNFEDLLGLPAPSGDAPTPQP
ncbi:MAG TPA: DUF6644 family protein [Vicinamibacterales bacterium]